MKNRVILVATSVLLIMGLLLGVVACAKPAPTPTPTTPTAPAAPKTIKIAHNISFLWPLGMDAKKMIQIHVDKINKSGGLDLGGQKYLIEDIWDDNKFDFALAKTIAQKQVNQDKVNFACGDPFTTGAFDIYDQSKTIFITSVYDLVVFDPKFSWIWNAGQALTCYPATVMYAAEQFPTLKTYVGAFPDRHDGRVSGAQFEDFAKKAGLTVLATLYYPDTQTDLSAIGTKIKQLNPQILVPYGGGPPLDAGIMKAAYAAGWRGQIVGAATMPAYVLAGIAGAEAVEGALCLAWPAEFDPPTNPIAVEFKNDWIAKFGKWEDPEITITTPYWRVINSVIKAGSVEPEKVKAVLDAPITYKTALGTHITFQRPKQGNMRYVDHVIGDLPTKTIKGGKAVYLHDIPVQKMKEYIDKMYGM